METRRHTHRSGGEGASETRADGQGTREVWSPPRSGASHTQTPRAATHRTNSKLSHRGRTPALPLPYSSRVLGWEGGDPSAGVTSLPLPVLRLGGPEPVSESLSELRLGRSVDPGAVVVSNFIKRDDVWQGEQASKRSPLRKSQEKAQQFFWGSHIRYPAVRRFALQFIAGAKLQF